jgi:pyridoxine 4-dehydrogenase
MARTIRVGDTEVARVGLGTNRLANTPENQAFIRAAVEAGVGMIDTARTYVGGESEATIGAALDPMPAGVVVATKGGYRDASPDVLRSEIEESLRSLRTDAIALYYLHKPDPERPIEESLAPIGEYREAGSIHHVGVSNVTVEQIERARQVVPIVAVQNRYSVSSREHDDVVDYCEREGIVFVPYFPLRGAGDPKEALAWVLRRSSATLPIPGTLSIEHLRNNLAALDGLG